MLPTPLIHPRPLVIPLPDDGWSLTWFYNMMEIFFVVVFLPFLAPCLNLVIHWTTPLDFDPQEPLGAGDGGVTCAVEQIPHTYSNQPLD